MSETDRRICRRIRRATNAVTLANIVSLNNNSNSMFKNLRQDQSIEVIREMEFYLSGQDIR